MARKTGSWWRAYQLDVYERLKGLPPPPPNPVTLFLELHHGRLSGQVPGLVRGGAAAMGEALGWKASPAARMLGQLVAMGPEVIEHDDVALVTYLPGRLTELPPPPSWKNLVGQLRELATVPACSTRHRFLVEMLHAWQAIDVREKRVDYLRRTVDAFPELAPEHARMHASHACSDADSDSEDLSPKRDRGRSPAAGFVGKGHNRAGSQGFGPQGSVDRHRESAGNHVREPRAGDVRTASCVCGAEIREGWHPQLGWQPEPAHASCSTVAIERARSTA